MKQALALYWESIKALWEDLFTLILANLLWFGIGFLPLILALSATWLLPPAVAWVGVGLTLLTLPVATAGLNLLANEIAHERRVALSLFWWGVREYFWRALGVGVIDLLLAAVIVANYVFYGQFAATWAPWVQGAWMALGVFWMALQVYLYPFLMEQIPRNVLLPFRNSALMVLATPFVTGVALVLALLTLGLSLTLAFPFLAGGVSLISLYANKLALAKLEDFKRLREENQSEFEEGDGTEPV
ncbi:MAG: hypothetical protein ACUVXG_03220 [Anaerolineae bacterium]